MKKIKYTCPVAPWCHVNHTGPDKFDRISHKKGFIEFIPTPFYQHLGPTTWSGPFELQKMASSDDLSPSIYLWAKDSTTMSVFQAVVDRRLTPGQGADIFIEQRRLSKRAAWPKYLRWIFDLRNYLS